MTLFYNFRLNLNYPPLTTLRGCLKWGIPKNTKLTISYGLGYAIHTLEEGVFSPILDKFSLSTNKKRWTFYKSHLFFRYIIFPFRLIHGLHVFLAFSFHFRLLGSDVSFLLRQRRNMLVHIDFRMHLLIYVHCL